MKLMVNKITREILDAFADDGHRQVPDFAKVVDVPGDPETFPWPHPQGASSCIWDGTAVKANPAVPARAPRPGTRSAGHGWDGLPGFLAEKFAMTEEQVIAEIEARGK